MRPRTPSIGADRARRRAARVGRRQAGAAGARSARPRRRWRPRHASRPPPMPSPAPSAGLTRPRPAAARRRRRPAGRAQRNFTDPDSRILKTRDGFVQGYNGQAAVDGAHQIIVAQRLTTNGSDQDRPGAAARRRQSRARAPAARGLGRRRLLPRGQSRGARGARHPRLPRHRPRAPTAAPDPSGRRRIKPGRRMAAMAAQAQARRPAHALSPAQADGRAGVRPDQAGARLPPVPAARLHQGRGTSGRWSAPPTTSPS